MKAAEGSFRLSHQTLSFLIAQITKAAGEVNEVLGFGQRSACDAKKVQIIALTIPGGTLGNVRWDGIGSTANLAGETVDFFSWKMTSLLVNCHSEIVRDLPSPYFCIIPHVNLPS